jgi:hypothetical protein
LRANPCSGLRRFYERSILRPTLIVAACVMERSKHRRYILLGFVLLAGAMVLLLSRPWVSAPDPVSEAVHTPTTQAGEPQREKGELAVAAAASNAAQTSIPSTAPITGFRGRIIDAITRSPVPEFDVAMIRVRRETYTQDAPITRSFKSATGRFVWADAAEGTWQAAVTAPGYQQFNVDDLQITAGKATREIVMPLQRGYAVRGRVFERSTGAGIVDAVITFRPVSGDEDFSGRRRHAKSKDDGAFVLDGIPGGDVALIVSAQDHAQRVVRVFVDEKTPAQEIEISTGGVIAGRVTTAAGAPVKGSILIRGPGINFFSETDPEGLFSYKHMRAGPYQISANTSAGASSVEFTLSEDEIKDTLILMLEAGHGIRGVIRSARAEQLKDVEIMLRSDSRPGTISAPVDPQGAYVLNGVPPGRAVMTVFSSPLQFNKTVDMPVDRDITVNIDLPAGSRLSGRITQGGKPVPSRTVWMRPVDSKDDMLYSSASKEDGQYEIEGLPAGEYFLRANEDISRRITIAGDAVLNIDIPLVQLSARVVEDGAVPIVGANVYVRGSAPETSRVRGDKQTDDFGQFALTGIEPGEIVLMVYKPGYELHREKIAYSSPITNRTITLRKSAGVEVRVPAGSRRFPRGFTLTQYAPGNQYAMDLWMPLDREGVCHVPGELAGTTLNIGRFSGDPIVIEDWDGQSFELK